jgi:hypothetical protein
VREQEVSHNTTCLCSVEGAPVLAGSQFLGLDNFCCVFWVFQGKGRLKKKRTKSRLEIFPKKSRIFFTCTAFYLEKAIAFWGVSWRG